MDLTHNPEMSFSYDNMAPMLETGVPPSPLFPPSSSPFPSPTRLPYTAPSPIIPRSPRRERDGYSPDSSSNEEEKDESVTLTLPVPVQARHPPPLPNLPLLQARPAPRERPAPQEVRREGVRELPQFSGAVGMTAMWIPSTPSLSSSRTSLAASRTSLTSLTSSSRAPKIRPRTNTGPDPDRSSGLSRRLSVLSRTNTVLPDKGSRTVEELLVPACRLQVQTEHVSPAGPS